MIPRFLLIFALIQPTIVSLSFDATQCEITKGCHLPEAKDSIDMGVAWNLLDDETLELELFVSTDNKNGRYVAVGFSDDAQMGNEPVIECSAIGGQPPSMKFSFDKTVGKGNQRIEGDHSAHFSNTTTSFQDGELYCKATVKVSGSAAEPNVFKYDPSADYYLLLANGKTTAKGLGFHSAQSSVSRKIRLAENSGNFEQLDNIGFDNSQCGTKKGCFQPTDCQDGCADIKASWEVLSPTKIHVELTGLVNTTNTYVAMGFSTNSRMGNTSVIECSSFDNSEFSMTFSYNYVTENYQNQRPTANVDNLFENRRVQFVDGVLYCSADVTVEGNANDPTVFKYVPEQKYSMILATGATNGTEKMLKYHFHKRSVAPEQLLSDYTMPTAAPPPSGEGSFDSTQCGQTKACYQPNDNDAVSYRVINDSAIEFEFSSKAPSSAGVYLALGFSADGKMGPASVIECSSLGGDALSMKFSHNSPSSNERISGEEAIRAQYITNAQTSFVNGVIYCRGTVRSDGNANAQIFKYTPNQKYFLIVARGTTTAGGLGYHDTNRFVSSQRLLTDINAGNGSGSKVTLVILHAIFMTVAWMTMVPTAVIFARVLRSSWPTLKPGGLLIWFHIHRGANLIGITLMIAGFVLILIHKDWKFVTAGWGGKHAIIGIIALCLAWLQPFISTLRCSPNDPRRPIFNYIHRGIGVIAMVLATTAICIAGYHFTPQRNVPQLVLALIPISVIFALSLFFIIFNNVVDVDTKSFAKPQNGARTEDIPMRPTSKTETETTWTIRSPQSQSTEQDSSERREVPVEKKRLWVNRFREFVVYGAVLIFVAIGTILSVFFALGLSG